MQPPALIPIERVDALCEDLERHPSGRLSVDAFLEVLAAVEQLAPCASDKIHELRSLVAKTRIPDVAQHNARIRACIHGIRLQARIRNWNERWRFEEGLKFRAEMSRPWSHAVPLVFVASVYVDDKLHGTLACEVSAQDLDLLPLSNRWLSKRQAQRRRIDEWYGALRHGFAAHVEKLWADGVDVANLSRIRWSDVRPSVLPL